MHPTFVQLGPLTIATYGVLVAVGFLVGLALAGHRARQDGIPAITVQQLGVWLIAAGILGGKLFYVVFFWRDFIAGWHDKGIGSLREGFVFFGGFLAAVLTTVVFARKNRLPLGKLADALAPGVALGHFFGRLGCFLNGCCFGAPTSVPWAVRFPAGHVSGGVPVHPTQLYEAAGNLVIAGLLLWWTPRRRFAGQVAWGYAVLYGAMRSVVEFFRGDYPRRFVLDLTLAQVIAVVLVVLGIMGHEWSRRRNQAR